MESPLLAKLATQQQHSSKQDARAKRSDFRTEQQAFIALRILYGYSYGLNFVAQSPPSQSPAQSWSSSRKIRVLSDRMNVDKLSLRIQILSEEAFLVFHAPAFSRKNYPLVFQIRQILEDCGKKIRGDPLILSKKEIFKIKDQILKRMQKANSIQMDKNASLQIDDFQEISYVYHLIIEFE